MSCSKNLLQPVAKTLRHSIGNPDFFLLKSTLNHTSVTSVWPKNKRGASDPPGLSPGCATAHTVVLYTKDVKSALLRLSGTTANKIRQGIAVRIRQKRQPEVSHSLLGFIQNVVSQQPNGSLGPRSKLPFRTRLPCSHTCQNYLQEIKQMSFLLLLGL